MCTNSTPFKTWEQSPGSEGHTWRRKRNKRPHRNIAGGTEELDGWDNWEYGTFKHHWQPGDRTDEEQDLENEDFLWKFLTVDEISTAITTLQGHASEERNGRFEQVLSTRTQRVRLVYENPANANNMWAALRTLDAFGLQFIDVIMDPNQYKAGCPRRKTMVSAMGAQKWLTIQHHHDTPTCLAALREQGYRIIATDVREGAKPISGIDWGGGSGRPLASFDPRPIAVVFGNEMGGISEGMRQACDETFYIPMKGFAESLNVSVAAAVLCSVLEVVY